MGEQLFCSGLISKQRRHRASSIAVHSHHRTPIVTPTSNQGCQGSAKRSRRCWRLLLRRCGPSGDRANWTRRCRPRFPAIWEPEETPRSFRPMHPPQHPPCGHELLNGGGWRQLPSVEAAVLVRCLVDAFHAGNTEHRQTACELCQFIPTQNRLRFGAACHNWILADSLFVRYLICASWREWVQPRRTG